MKIGLDELDYEFILNNTSDGITVCNIGGEIIYSNSPAKKILGLENVGINSLNWSNHFGLYDPVTKEEYPNHKLPLMKALSGETVNGGELFIQNKNIHKGVYVNVNSSPIFDKDGVIVGGISIFHDITEKYIQKLKLIESNEHLCDFANSVSHDVKSPVGSSMGLIQCLLDNISHIISPADIDIIKRIKVNQESILALASGLLEYSNPVDKNIDTIDLNVIANDLKDMFKDNTETSQLDIVINNLPRIKGANIVFRKVFQNLFENSIKYSREGIPTKIELSSTINENKDILIHCKDNGLGFNDCDSDKIFHPLTRVHSGIDKIGSGLGLAICKKLLEENNCMIWATSEEEFGSTFSILIPKNLIVL